MPETVNRKQKLLANLLRIQQNAKKREQGSVQLTYEPI